jgi:hypothetical protein
LSIWVYFDDVQAIIGLFLFCQLIYSITDWYYSSPKSDGKLHPYKKLPKVEQMEWQTRVVSTIHAVVVFPLCVWLAFFVPEFRENPIFGDHPLASFCFAFDVGYCFQFKRKIKLIHYRYFFCDLLIILKYKIPPLAPIVCHHLFAGYGLLMCLVGIKITSIKFLTESQLSELLVGLLLHYLLLRVQHHSTTFIGFLKSLKCNIAGDIGW